MPVLKCQQPSSVTFCHVDVFCKRLRESGQKLCPDAGNASGNPTGQDRCLQNEVPLGSQVMTVKENGQFDISLGKNSNRRSQRKERARLHKPHSFPRTLRGAQPSIRPGLNAACHPSGLRGGAALRPEALGPSRFTTGTPGGCVSGSLLSLCPLEWH